MPSLSLLKRFHSPSAVELDAARAARSSVEDPVQQLLDLGDGWLSLLEYEHESERLANAASINRWQSLRLAEQAAETKPPELLLSLHREVMALLSDAGRAFQLLATGHRFHKTEAVCDGQTLLVASLSSARRVLRSLDEQLGMAD